MSIAQEAAAVVETRADVINIVVEELVQRGHELPAFRTLDEIAEAAHASAQELLYDRITAHISAAVVSIFSPSNAVPPPSPSRRHPSLGVWSSSSCRPA